MPSRRSQFGLNATNFFLGQVVAVVLPFLNTLLRQRGWSYEAIGIATSIVGIGVFFAQTPAGLLLDRFRRPRAILAMASLGVGIGYAAVPAVAASFFVTQAMLLVAGISQAFLAPGLAGLAVDLAGPRDVGRLLGPNRMANHIGHVAAALAAMAAAAHYGAGSIFIGVFLAAALAAASCIVIRASELQKTPLPKPEPVSHPRERTWKTSLASSMHFNRAAMLLIGTTALFHMASAPAIPLAALYLEALPRGNGGHVAAMVLVAQIAMIPAAYVAGLVCDRVGRRPLFLAAFIAMPLRSVVCALSSDPNVVVVAQVLEGLAAGIEGVALVSMCADLSVKNGRFNTLMALATMPLGAVVGPLGTALLIEHAGFRAAFGALALTGFLGAAVFYRYMPETVERSMAGGEGAAWAGGPR